MNVLATLKGAGLAAKAFTIANGPTILFVGGLVVGAIAIASAIHDAVTKSTDDLEDAIDDIHSANELLKNPGEETDISEVKHAKKASVARFLKTLLRLYGKTLALAIVSALLLAGGFYWQSKRFAIASAAAASTAAVLSTVDSNVKSLFGEEGVRAMHDPNFDPEAFKAKAAANGKAEALEGINDEFKEYRPSGVKVPGDWIFTYRQETADDGFWSDNTIDNVLRVVNVQATANQMLSTYIRSFVSVNEVLEMLGLKNMYGTTAGQMFGWGIGDYVDLGIDDILAKFQCDIDGKVKGRYLGDIWRSYTDGIVLHMENVRYASDTVIKGGRPMKEVMSI